MTTVSELLAGGIADGDCGLCIAHDQMTGGMVCPVCGGGLGGDFGVVPVGETNVAAPDEQILMMPVARCGMGHTIALVPTEITWNANHDVYYTGGRRYLPRSLDERLTPKLRDAFGPSIRQWVVRREQGERLDETHLTTWLVYDAAQVVAAFLRDLLPSTGEE